MKWRSVVSFELSQNLNVIKRQAYSLTDYLADVGGLAISLKGIAFAVLSALNYHGQFQVLTSQMYAGSAKASNKQRRERSSEQADAEDQLSSKFAQALSDKVNRDLEKHSDLTSFNNLSTAETFMNNLRYYFPFLFGSGGTRKTRILCCK